jgi:predicted RNA-binding Zn ribbon-like protein
MEPIPIYEAAPPSIAFAEHVATASGSSSLGPWLVEQELLTREPEVTGEDEAEAGILGAAIARALAARAAHAGLASRDVATINSYADGEPPNAILRDDGSYLRTSPTPIAAALAAIARDAIETIARHGRLLRTCEAANCGTVFLDRSRGGRRRWCSMTRCGNRAKAAAFRQRAAG